MSIFQSPGLYLRQPRGGIEDVARMASAGFRWVALNIGDHTLDEWHTIRERAGTAGIACLPWAYVRSDRDVWKLRLVGAAHFERRFIVNAEKELDIGAVSIAEIAAACDGCDAAISTEPVLYGNVDWTRVAGIPIQLQLFPQENLPSLRPRDCRALAYSRGIRQAHFMLGVHDLSPNGFPARQGPYSVYVADDIAFRDGLRDYERWGPQSAPALEVPFTGPLYGPSRKAGGRKSNTAVALKIACHRLGVANFGNPDLYYNRTLEEALARLQRLVGLLPTGQYGQGTYQALLSLISATPGEGYALSPGAVDLIQEDAA